MFYWLNPEGYPDRSTWNRQDEPAYDAYDELEPPSALRDRIAENWRDIDERLVDEVAAGLVDDVAVTGGQLHLCVQNGVVILDGTVQSESVRAAAVARAWATPGVMDVCDALVVTPMAARGHHDR
ncbi:BON domain-containing protein [Mangrovihabitans endophyticus]|uniref:BON domain-containing protein n=1 Tax=Mangrovihabitans endophyticus TaxID=1751298 RepID=A0A8J3C2J0_9ACTN|nr:BON domain-containing protein [Mangrovihabitans endophyticus]GGK99857.1 hypothetical protein GCM10012284_37840 [Mangrovihabitans endophyticus]